MMRLILLLAWLVLSAPSRSQSWFIKSDLTDSLKLYQSGKWVAADEQETKSAWLLLSANRYRGDYLFIRNNEPFHVFAEGKLLASEKKQVQWPVDSLAALFNKNIIRINVYCSQGIQSGLRAYVATLLPVPAEVNLNYRLVEFYRDFLLLALLIACMLLLVMLKVNKLLVLSYLDIRALLSIRESEDRPMYNRVTNTTNILLLLLVGFIFSVLQIHPGEETNFSKLWYMSFIVTITTSAVLAAKGVVIFIFSSIFRIQSLKGLQYVGFLRFLLVCGLVILAIQAGRVFIFPSLSLNLVMNRWLIWIIGLTWLVLIGSKLRFQTRFSSIHLFSYLCATEIGPLLLTATTIWKV
ncbi:MAG: DUF4271 domain-containing protein [Cyclobacteriaceae bacterium]|nr:DUF4271 domain-containing protein [Cyclobacteriaceae bacterium]